MKAVCAIAEGCQLNDVRWETEHSVETSASLAFAWTYMSQVTNWDDPPAQFELHGLFVTGGQGTTQMPGRPTQHWQLRDVRPMESYTVEFRLDRATLSFEWRFKALPGGRTRLTQQVALKGENASAYLADIQGAFTSGLAPGMRRIAMAIDKAYAAG
jgi:Polyketide cyclase / dehydrase and lipid transport